MSIPGQSINIPFSEMVVIDDPIAAKAAFTISVDGTALRNDQFSINAYGGASSRSISTIASTTIKHSPLHTTLLTSTTTQVS